MSIPVLQDTLAGIRVVQSFANEEIEREKFRRAIMDFWYPRMRTISVWEAL